MATEAATDSTAEMSREEIEARIVADHIALRGLVARMESVASQITRGERRLLGSLRTEAEALYESLRTHNRWENRTLLPRLRITGALGEQRAHYLEEDHCTQLEIVARGIQSLEAQDLPPESLAREMIELAAQLRDDLTDEEEMVLDEKVWGPEPGAAGTRRGGSG